MAEMAERAVRQELETEDPVHTLSVAGSVALGRCLSSLDLPIFLTWMHRAWTEWCFPILGRDV